MKEIFILIILLFFSKGMSAQLPTETIDLITTEINKIRGQGLRCGKTKMAPVHDIYWNDDLYHVSQNYASYMKNRNHFAHISLEGEDAGKRLDDVGYEWRFVGENIAKGQVDFPEVLKDWKKSESHCKMLMSKDMFHFAVARDGKYWVQTFATPMRR